MMKLVSEFFFNRKICGVTFKRIDDGIQCEINNFYVYRCRRNFQKNLKIGVGNFYVAIHNIFE